MVVEYLVSCTYEETLTLSLSVKAYYLCSKCKGCHCTLQICHVIIRKNYRTSIGYSKQRQHNLRAYVIHCPLSTFDVQMYGLEEMAVKQREWTFSKLCGARRLPFWQGPSVS